ncbi:MAG: S8 family serine peptidase [Bacteroidota bacterium]|nr:S8 family serine peptidase [Bacteroidota bacterium]
MNPKLIITALVTFAILNVNAQREPKPIPDQYIVVLKESSAKPVVKDGKKNNNREEKVASNKAARDKNIAKLKSVAKGKNIKESSVVNEFADVLVGFTAKLNGAEKKALESDPDVQYVAQDYSVELEPIKDEAKPQEIGSIFNPRYNEKEEIRSGPSANSIDNTYVKNDAKNFAQVVPCTVTRAGGFVDGSGKSTWIWILDTGIDLTHPDLNVITSSTFAKSFIAGQTVQDGNSHGTHCAGTAAAKNNTIGVVGVSAGAKVVPVKVLNNAGSGSFSGILAGLNHVAMYDIAGDVVSMSIGGYPVSNCENSDPSIRDAIRNLGNAGTFVVMAAGNDYNCNGAGSNLPGCINGNRVYTVGALNCDLTKASYSNGGQNVDYVAVGSGVYSTIPGGLYGTKSGTSMATPCVAGVIHARGSAPANGGNIAFCGTTKPLAHR